MDALGFHFEWSHWLWITAILVANYLALVFHAARARRRQLAAFAHSEQLAPLLAAHSPARRVVKNVLTALAITALGLALARPQWGYEHDENDRAGEDTIFLIDTSKSMLAEDVKPNRIERAKLAVQEYVRQHGRGRVGLVAFAGQAFLQCPLTLDYDAFYEALAAITVETIPVPGSDLARGLEEAALAMMKTEGRKLMVLLTDGEDLEKDGVRVAKDLGKDGITVYTVGVGTEAGALIQIPNVLGEPDVLRDRNGQPVRSRLDETTLRAIADATGGEFHPLGGIGEGMARVLKSVNSTNGELGVARARARGVDRFHWPLAVAILLLVIESLITSRRSLPRMQSSKEMQSQSTMSAATAIALALMVPVCVGRGATADRTAHLDTPREYYNEGARLMKEGNYRDAEGWLLKAAAANVESVQPPALYNLGHVRFSQGRELLKGQQSRAQVMNTGLRAEEDGHDSIRFADAALRTDDLQTIIAAYLQGRAARKQMRLAAEDIQRALDLYGAVLTRWHRAVGDFRGAEELDTQNKDAGFNADVVEKHIDELLKQMKALEQMQQMIQGTREGLKPRMSELRKRIPESMRQQGEGEEDEEEEEQPQPDSGFQDTTQRTGEERGITPEMAQRILESLRDKMNGKLPLGPGGEEMRRPRDRKGRDW